MKPALARLRSWLRGTLRRRTLETDMEQELQTHIEMRAADLERSGLSPTEARRRARADFGVIAARKDECRDDLGLKLPPGFEGMMSGEHADLFLPLTSQPLLIPSDYAPKTHGSILPDPDTWWVQIMLRLQPGVDEARTRAAFDTTLRNTVYETLPQSRHRDMPRLMLSSGSRGLDELRRNFGKPISVLVAVAGLVLLIAFANLANLLLARATVRHREIGIRLALGARRGRVIRQMLTEGLMLTILGVLLGYWLRNGIPSLVAQPWESNPIQADFDVRVLVISVALTFLTGILFSIAPAWRSSAVPSNAALKEGGRSTAGTGSLWAGRSLVVFQISLSLMLVAGAALFVRTLMNLQTASLGFQPDRVVLFTIDAPRARYSAEAGTRLFLQLEDLMQSIPGVQASTLSEEALVANNTSTTTFDTPGPAGKPKRIIRTWINQVGDRFFETMGIPVLAGRSLDNHDRLKTPYVAVVNQAFARLYFPRESIIGKTLAIRDHHQVQIVGLCGDAHFNDVRTPAPPTMYTAFAQSEFVGHMTFELKTAASTASIMKLVRDRVRSVDKDLPAFGVRTQNEQIAATFSQERLFAALTSDFGILALLLAAVGVYGVMAYAVARRTNEIGLRMALGAQKTQVLRMILRESALLGGTGIAIGLLATVAVSGYLRSMLYGLKPSDPAAISGAVLLLLAIALLAGWLPARRASRLDPMVALRHE